MPWIGRFVPACWVNSNRFGDSPRVHCVVSAGAPLRRGESGPPSDRPLLSLDIRSAVSRMSRAHAGLDPAAGRNSAESQRRGLVSVVFSCLSGRVRFFNQVRSFSSSARSVLRRLLDISHSARGVWGSARIFSRSPDWAVPRWQSGPSAARDGLRSARRSRALLSGGHQAISRRLERPLGS
jgi:hypothetical protein